MIKSREISLSHSFKLTTLLFQFSHSFNQAVVVALNDVSKVGPAILHKKHVKQEPEQIPGRIHRTPVQVDSF